MNTEHSEPVASIQIYFEGRPKFFPHREGTNGPKREAGRVESGVGFLGGGSELRAPPLARGLWGALYKQKCVSYYRKAKTLKGRKDTPPGSTPLL